MSEFAKVTIDGKRGLRQSIVNDISARIERRALLPGDRLPSVLQLSRSYDVSHVTIRSAILELGRRGYVISRARSGNYVAAQPVSNPATLGRQSHVPTDTLRADSAPPILIGTLAVSYQATPADAQPDDHHAHWVWSVLRGFEQAAGKYNAVTRYLNLPDPTRLHLDFPKFIGALREEKIAGLLIADVHDSPGFAEEVMQLAAIERLPIVYVSSGKTCAPPIHVYNDNVVGGEMAAKHLLSRGFQRLVFVSHVDAVWATERYNGVVKAWRKFGAFPTEQVAFWPSLDDRCHVIEIMLGEMKPAVVDAIRASVSTFDGRIGIVASNDPVARLVHDLLRERGLIIGKDYGLVGFDDEPPTRAASYY